ncbi:MAG TPA: VOC family protein [Candidatus Spyradocola merdavium]|nr:VOC family protein [Candidatus Spyradocola merdavium]
MEKGILGTKIVTQIGFVVNDIEKTSQAFADFLGVEKPQWSLTDTIDKTHGEFNGEPCPARAKLAFFHVGETLDIELIEPDETPSVWRNVLNEKGEGVHHIAFVVNGMKEKILALEGNGMKLLQRGEYTGGRYAYIDCVDQLKTIVELLEND